MNKDEWLISISVHGTKLKPNSHILALFSTGDIWSHEIYSDQAEEMWYHICPTHSSYSITGRALFLNHDISASKQKSEEWALILQPHNKNFSFYFMLLSWSKWVLSVYWGKPHSFTSVEHPVEKYHALVTPKETFQYNKQKTNKQKLHMHCLLITSMTLFIFLQVIFPSLTWEPLNFSSGLSTRGRLRRGSPTVASGCCRGGEVGLAIWVGWKLLITHDTWWRRGNKFVK